MDELKELFQRLGYYDTWSIEYQAADSVGPDIFWYTNYQINIEGTNYEVVTDDLAFALKTALGRHEAEEDAADN